MDTGRSSPRSRPCAAAAGRRPAPAPLATGLRQEGGLRRPAPTAAAGHAGPRPFPDPAGLRRRLPRRDASRSARCSWATWAPPSPSRSDCRRSGSGRWSSSMTSWTTSGRLCAAWRTGTSTPSSSSPPIRWATCTAGRQAVLRVLHSRLDPVELTIIGFASRLAVAQVNATVLATLVSEAQGSGVPVADAPRPEQRWAEGRWPRSTPATWLGRSPTSLDWKMSSADSTSPRRRSRPSPIRQGTGSRRRSHRHGQHVSPILRTSGGRRPAGRRAGPPPAHRGQWGRSRGRSSRGPRSRCGRRRRWRTS